jgi:glutamate-1-semialdehyde 2,1-aminomutase
MASRSAEWFSRAMAVIPGGVDSPSRSFRGVGGGVPPVMARGAGAYIYDADGRRYLDYQAAYGPLVLGHAHPAVVKAVGEALPHGFVTGATHPLEVQWAERLTQAVRGLDWVRFVSTGTEAVMSALRLARGATGRRQVVKFGGLYHGHSDAMLVKAGSGAATVGAGTSAGVTAGVTNDVEVLRFNDPDAVADHLERAGQDTACLLVEPVVGNSGTILPRPGYLAALRALADRHGALLVFDEVITAFRFRYGAVEQDPAVVPDLYCLGKVIGGGLPAGAYGGRAALAPLLAPAGPVYQAGTHAGNPLAAAAGLATLDVLAADDPYPRMAQLAARLANGLLDHARRHGVAASINRKGGMFTLFFTEGPVEDGEGAEKASRARFAAFYRALLDRGVYLAPSPLECWFVSAAHTEADVDCTLEAADAAMALAAATAP